jgi:hypothetical protein
MAMEGSVYILDVIESCIRSYGFKSQESIDKGDKYIYILFILWNLNLGKVSYQFV